MAGGTVAVPLPRPLTARARAALRWMQHRVLLVFSIVVLTMLVITGVFAPLIAPHDPKRGDLDDKNTPPLLDG